MNFGVTTEELKATSQVLGSVSTDFLSEVKKMYNSLDDLIAKWKGKGAEQYYKGILRHKSDLEALGLVIEQYSTFLNKAAVSYDTTDSDIASSANSQF